MIAQIILDIIMLIILVIGIFTGRQTEVDAWIALVWVFIALFAHLRLKEEEDLK